MHDDSHGGHLPTDGPGHELTDISISAVTYFLIGLGIVLLVTGVGLYWFFEQMESEARLSDAAASPVAKDQTPPAPQLQVSAAVDMQAFRASEQQRLASYGWVDEKNGIVHMPITDAIERVARDGVPNWPAVENPPAEGAR